MIKVYHAINPTFFDAHQSYAIIDDFTLVAEVETEDLETAYMLTNNIDHSWTLNGAVNPTASIEMRSTSVGDLMFDGEDWHMVAGVGFRIIDVVDKLTHLWRVS